MVTEVHQVNMKTETVVGCGNCINLVEKYQDLSSLCSLVIANPTVQSMQFLNLIFYSQICIQKHVKRNFLVLGFVIVTEDG